MQRDYMRDDPRRRPRSDSDPRDVPIERYGNEEDQYSREYRQTYAEENLPERLRDDSPYNRPGYEPEAGRPGGRENVDLHRGQHEERFGPRTDPRSRPASRETGGWRPPSQGQGQYPGQPQQRGREQYGSQRPSGSQSDPYGQSAYRQLASPYDDDNAIGPWYGGDTGMGDPGSSQRAGQGQQGGYRQDDRFTGRTSSQADRGGSAESWAEGRSSSWGDGPQGGGGTQGRQQSTYDDSQRSRFGSGQQSYQGQQFGGQRDWQQQGQHDPLDGPFTGRGPRNYQRSDERIRDDVCELLTRHGGIDASQMDVDVRQGVVTLRGSVDSGRVRRMAEELVEDLAGVRDVQNDLRVNRQSGYIGDAGGRAGQGDATGAGEQRSTPAYGMGVSSTSGVSTRSGPGEPGVGAGAGPSQQGNPWQVHETMDVVGADGESVGTVKLVAGTDFVLNRPMARDLHVPFSAVKTVDGDRVMLSCRSGEVDQQNWPTSDLAGSGTTTGRTDRPATR